MDYKPNTLGLKVNTPSGWMDFEGIADMGDAAIWRIRIPENDLLCSPSHRVMTRTGLKTAPQLTTSDEVLLGTGDYAPIVGAEETGDVARVYDLIQVGGGHLYHTNGMVSHNCEFVTDDETLIDPVLLSKMPHVEPVFYTENVRWFVDDFEPNRPYMVGLDPASGTGGDFSAIQVFQLPEMIQVGEWQSNRTKPRDQVKQLMQILMFLDDSLRANPDQEIDPEIFWSFENNGVGEAILTVIDDTGVDRFPGQLLTEKKKKGKVRKTRKGFHTSASSKTSTCARFKSLVESDRCLITSERLVRQLKQFVASGNSFKGKAGEKDDLVMATILIVRMLEVAINMIDDSDILSEHIGDDELYGDSAPLPIVI